MSLVFLPEVVDPARRRSAVRRLRELGISLPTWTQLARPDSMPPDVPARIAGVEPASPDPANLWRTHWYNDEDGRRRAAVPRHLVLPPELTGIAATVIVLLGCGFPMIGAHKVLAAYACLVARLVSGRFDPLRDRAVWPSTGNYCRGGVAISRILGCRGIAVLPQGMSRERFDWLERWVSEPADIVRTPGTESNVKEIYDRCAELARDERNVIVNQFSEFGNYLIHHHCTGRAVEAVLEHLAAARAGRRLAAFVAATGSAGTLAAGDYLATRHGSRTVAVEAVECPTMLYNGYGEHNIQGIGDKHIPLIHNVMNTDVVVGVSDRASDALNLLFGSATGTEYLIRRRAVDPDLVHRFGQVGISGLANIIAAIKLARYFDYGADAVVATVATDGADLYASERQAYAKRRYPNGFDDVNAGELFARHLEGAATDHVLELSHRDRQRVFQLGYFTWVEQQGVALEDFERRKDQAYWRSLVDGIPAWDRMIEEFNADVGAARSQRA